MNMDIAIVGAGVVGRATGTGFALNGSRVVFYDIDPEKRWKIENSSCHTNMKFMGVREAVRASDASFICVPTPTTLSGCYDLTYVESAARSVGRALAQKKSYHVIVLRSTVTPGVTRNVVKPILEDESGKKAGKDFGLAFNPEFLRVATALEDFLNPSRIVIGEYDRMSGDVLEVLYSSFNASMFRVDLEVAEMSKLVANAFLSMKISFFNEVYLWCQKLGVDQGKVSQIAATDPRIGTYGSHGGRPFGGSCLPKDLDALIHFLNGGGEEPLLLTATKMINEIIKVRGVKGSEVKKGVM